MEQTQTVKKKDIIVKVLTCLLALSLWMVYRLFYIGDGKRPWDYKYCFKDKLLTDYLGDLTKYMSQHLILRDLILITASNLLDVFFFTFLITFTIKGKSWVPPVHFLLFYGIRNALIQSIVILGFYDTYLFEDPGFPSMFVPFFRAPDFFYSGHAGCALVLAFQYAELGYNELFYFGVFLSFYEGLVMTITRSHYSIDVIFGILMGHYTYFLAKEIGRFLDKHVPICGQKKYQKIEEENKGEVHVHVDHQNYDQVVAYTGRI